MARPICAQVTRRGRCRVADGMQYFVANNSKTIFLPAYVKARI